MAKPICGAPNCSTTSAHIGLCNRHYLQKRRHGKFITSTRDKRGAVVDGDVAKLPLGMSAKDGFAIIDSKFAYLGEDNWRKTHYGYVIRSRDKKLLHRVILSADKEAIVDHKNGDPLDNRLKNIRLCTQRENSRNQRLKKSNTSGYKGVSKSRTGAFVARIRISGKYLSLGCFTNALEAAIAYDKAAIKHHKEYARLNNG